MEILIIGIIINTLLFGYIAFTNEKTGIRHKIPAFFLYPIVDTILTVSYFASFLIILLAPGGLIRNIIIAILMQFFINHFLWGTIMGIIGGLDSRKILKEIQQEIKSPPYQSITPKEVDPLINHAVDVICKYEYDHVSASLFQRRLMINYARAESIVDTLSQYGIIERTSNSIPNKILIADTLQLKKIKQVFDSLPKYDLERFKEEDEETNSSIISNDQDSIYPEVLEFIKDKKQISAEILQKKFGIGYARACRILDHLEEEGIIESPIGNQPRKVLVAWKTNNPKLDSQGLMIVETLRSFGLETRIEEINKKKNGIEYALDVALGYPLEKVIKRQREIALAVASPTGKVIIEAPIPGRSLIGITVPIKK